MTLGRDPRTCEGQVRVRHQGNDGDVEDLREEHLVLCPGETLRPTLIATHKQRFSSIALR